MFVFNGIFEFGLGDYLLPVDSLDAVHQP